MPRIVFRDSVVKDGLPDWNENTGHALLSHARALEMTAFIERIVQKISEAAPLENAVSHLVAGVLENTATKLSSRESAQVQEGLSDVKAA